MPPSSRHVKLHGVDPLEVLYPKTEQVIVHGPAQVVLGAAYGGSYILEVFEYGVELAHSLTSGRMVSSIPAGQTKTLDLHSGVVLVDHREKVAA